MTPTCHTEHITLFNGLGHVHTELPETHVAMVESQGLELPADTTQDDLRQMIDELSDSVR